MDTTTTELDPQETPRPHHRSGWIRLAEAIRQLDIAYEIKTRLTHAAVGILADQPRFDPFRFESHALSDNPAKPHREGDEWVRYGVNREVVYTVPPRADEPAADAGKTEADTDPEG